MKLSKSVRLVLAVAAMLLFMTANVWAASSENVDWVKQTITVKGVGFAPKEDYSAVQARELARRAATADGYRRLAEVINGVNVTGETTVENLMVRSEKVTLKVKALVDGAKVIAERAIAPDGYEVIMEMPLFGPRNSLASGIFEKKAKNPFPNPVAGVTATVPAYNSKTPVQRRIEIVVNNVTNIQVRKSAYALNPAAGYVVQPLSQINISSINADRVNPATPQITTPEVPQVTKTEPIKTVEPVEEKSIGGYTGVIVDCRNLNLQPVMSPVIKNEDGQAIYGAENLDIDKVIEFGMASYATDMQSVDRAGKNPLVVKAVSVSDFNSNPVLSVADANRVLIENKSDKFLDNAKVVFIQ